MDTALQRKPFFRPPSQFEEWCINNFSLGFFMSSLICIARNLTVYYPNLANSSISLPSSPLVDSLIYFTAAILFLGSAHMRCKYMMTSHTKLHVFGLFMCTVLGWAIPTLLFSFALPEKLFATTIYECLKENLIQIFCGGLYTWIFVEAK